MTFDETADYLRLPKSTLYFLVAEGRGPRSAKLGKRRMFRREDVVQYVADRVAA
ncbi:helix-turn-helix transcriptional regulator [Inquilinus sp. OTU3971]|uniref:helix-turn-helix transcriptional regulator n=1 Tax=Inquilinus sp. OTU3971 TaxID=3043855 RepID=UPI00406BEF71